MDLPRLRRIRQGAVMSQEELAERSGVARDTIRKLAAGLEVRPQMLMGGVEYLEEGPESAQIENKPLEEPGRDRKVGF